ncbi:MAG: hypothetical protein R8K20_00640 [Gallionellaceae bacterium]
MGLILSSLLSDNGSYGPDMAMEICSEIIRMKVKVVSHPLGFIQSVISESGREYRINFWGTQLGHTKVPNWQIHTHRFNFRSRIIAGQLWETRYDVAENMDGELELYKVKYSTDGSVLQNSGRRVSANITTRQIHPSGTTYKIDATNFHSSGNHTKLALSIMEIGNVIEESPSVLGEVDYRGKFSPYLLQTIPPSDFMKAIDIATKGSGIKLFEEVKSA